MEDMMKPPKRPDDVSDAAYRHFIKQPWLDGLALGRKLLRVFPRRTRATPDDDLAYCGPPDLYVPAGVTEVHVSVAFTYDKARAEWLADPQRA